MNDYYIFRIKRDQDSNEWGYLTSDKKTFTHKKSQALLMTEAEANDKCNEYDDNEWICGICQI